jgi:hypothetical protein
MEGQADFDAPDAGRSAWEEKARAGAESAAVGEWRAALDRWQAHLSHWEDTVDDAKGDVDKFASQENKLRERWQILRNRESELRLAGAVFDPIEPFQDEAKFHPQEDDDPSIWEENVSDGKEPASSWKKALSAWSLYQDEAENRIKEIKATFDQAAKNSDQAAEDPEQVINDLAAREKNLRERMNRLDRQQGKYLRADNGAARPERSFPYGDRFVSDAAGNRVSWEKTVRAGQSKPVAWKIALDGWQRRLDMWDTAIDIVIDRAVIPLRARQASLLRQEDDLLKLEQQLRGQGLALDDLARGPAQADDYFRPEQGQGPSAWETRVRTRQMRPSVWGAALESWAARLNAWREEMWEVHPDAGVVARADGRGQWVPGMPGTEDNIQAALQQARAEAELATLRQWEAELRGASERLQAREDDLQEDGRDLSAEIDPTPFPDVERFLPTVAGPSAWEAEVQAGTASSSDWKATLGEWEAYQEKWDEALRNAEIDDVDGLAERENNLREAAKSQLAWTARLREDGATDEDLAIDPFPDEARFMLTAEDTSQWQMDVEAEKVPLSAWRTALAAWDAYLERWGQRLGAVDEDSSDAESEDEA